MKLIVKIAKNELRNLFYSPVAWFLAIVFITMCAFFYTSTLYVWAKGTHSLLINDPKWTYKAIGSVTAAIFSNLQGGFFMSILPNIYLFVPLLTMSIISREVNNGTIKLLYSSPVKIHQIVLGKYLALMVYNLMLVAIVGIFIGSGFFDIKSIDFPPLLSATLGFYLLLCALTAIGFFMSSLTTYPIVAAVASFTFLFMLMSVGSLWQQYDFIRDLTYFLSISGRTEKMVIGLITTKDVIYYLLIIGMFVAFTTLKLRSEREARPWYVTTGKYFAVLLCALVIGYISSRPGFIGYLDTTARKTNTIHPRTQQILKELGDSTLEVTLYVNLLDRATHQGRGFPSDRNNYLNEMWEQYQRFKPGINFKYAYYYAYDPATDDSVLLKTFPGKSLKQIAGLTARMLQVDSSLFVSPEDVHGLIYLKPEGNRLLMRLKYRGQEKTLRVTDHNGWGNFWSSEQNVNAVLKRLLGAKMPKVYFVSGELERSIHKSGEREYLFHTIRKSERGALVNIGFDVDTVNLSAADIPSDATTIVLADPKMELSPAVQHKLKSYIDQGGNMLILGEPRKQYVLNPLLQQLGIQLMSGQLVELSSNETPDKVGYFHTPATFDLAEESWLSYLKHLSKHNISLDSAIPVSLSGVTGISRVQDSGFTLKPLFMTKPGKAWLKAGRLVTDSVPPTFNPQEGDSKENSFLTAIQLSRQRSHKEQRIIILGDADLLSILRLDIDYVRAFYSWLSENKFPIYTPLSNARDNMVILSPARASVEKIVYVWIFPTILFITGAVLLMRRKRK